MIFFLLYVGSDVDCQSRCCKLNLGSSVGSDVGCQSSSCKLSLGSSVGSDVGCQSRGLWANVLSDNRHYSSTDGLSVYMEKQPVAGKFVCSAGLRYPGNT